MDELIKVIQLPILDEQWAKLKTAWEAKAAEAESLVCTPETIQSVKQYRADMRKEFEAAEEQRKAVKAAIFAPWEAAEATYKECVSEPFKAADSALKRKIDALESEIKQRCEDELREYFAELCAAHHVEWLRYEQAGITVDMASAKAKTPKKLREQLTDFVAMVTHDVETIANMDHHSEEIMTEYKRSLNLTDAFCVVMERQKRIESEREAMGSRAEQQDVEAEAVRKVEALAPPVVKQQESTIKVSLVLYPTKTQFKERIRPLLRQLKEICDMEGIKYE